jgi:hypothetical protein
MFSAIIEIIGIRDLAEIESKEYLDRIRSLKSILDENASKYKSYDVKIEGNRDYFFCRCPDINVLIKFISDVRMGLIKSQHTMFCRGVIKKGAYILTKEIKNENSKTSNFIFQAFNETAAELYGELNNLKGIAVKVEDSLLENRLVKIEDKLIFKNYIVQHYNRLLIREIYDIKLEVNKKIVKRICQKFNRSYQQSSRLAQYYIPVFNNLIISWGYKKINNSPPKRWAGGTVEQLLSSNYFNNYKSIKGMRLTYVFFIKQLISEQLSYEKTKNNNEPENIKGQEISHLINLIKKNLWLRNYIKEQVFYEMPQSLFDGKLKGKLIEKIYQDK